MKIGCDSTSLIPKKFNVVIEGQLCVLRIEIIAKIDPSSQLETSQPREHVAAMAGDSDVLIVGVVGSSDRLVTSMVNVPGGNVEAILEIEWKILPSPLVGHRKQQNRWQQRCHRSRRACESRKQKSTTYYKTGTKEPDLGIWTGEKTTGGKDFTGGNRGPLTLAHRPIGVLCLINPRRNKKPHTFGEEKETYPKEGELVWPSIEQKGSNFGELWFKG